MQTLFAGFPSPLRLHFPAGRFNAGGHRADCPGAISCIRKDLPHNQIFVAFTQPPVYNGPDE
jgi:hypothetical protein